MKTLSELRDALFASFTKHKALSASRDKDGMKAEVEVRENLERELITAVFEQEGNRWLDITQLRNACGLQVRVLMGHIQLLIGTGKVEEHNDIDGRTWKAIR
jgi:hypothetical protein